VCTPTLNRKHAFHCAMSVVSSVVHAIADIDWCFLSNTISYCAMRFAQIECVWCTMLVFNRFASFSSRSSFNQPIAKPWSMSNDLFTNMKRNNICNFQENSCTKRWWLQRCGVFVGIPGFTLLNWTGCRAPDCCTSHNKNIGKVCSSAAYGSLSRAVYHFCTP